MHEPAYLDAPAAQTDQLRPQPPHHPHPIALTQPEHTRTNLRPPTNAGIQHPARSAQPLHHQPPQHHPAARDSAGLGDRRAVAGADSGSAGLTMPAPPRSAGAARPVSAPPGLPRPPPP